MNPPRYLAFALIAPLLAVGWLILATLDPDPAPSLLEYPLIGNLIGAIFGQATLAAAWTALGPLPLAWRLPLALAWVASLPIAVGINIGVNGGPDEIAVIMAACALGQWILVQAPLWVLAIVYDLKVRYFADSGKFQGAGNLQFGIRQLMILTAIVAVLLGIGRLLVINFAAALGAAMNREAPIFIFLAVAGVLLTLPLVLAALLPRNSAAATLSVLVVTALATAWELPLLTSLVATGGGPDQWHFIWINAFQAGWVLAVIGLLRLGGYSLSSGRGESPFASGSC